VIVATGGVMGLGSTLTAVPPSAFHHDVAQKVLHLDASKEKLAAAPKFDAANWDENTQSNRLTQSYGYYGQQPYFVTDREEMWTTNLDGTFARTLPRHMDGTINTTGARTMDTAHNIDVASDVVATNNVRLTQNPDGTWDRNYYANGNDANSSWSQLGYVQKASKIMGMTVKDAQDKKIGSVENLIVDLSAGRIVAVIISAGGYAGIGDELSYVPANGFRYNDARDTLQLDTSKEKLANSKHFNQSEWPDFNQPAYAGGAYHADKVEARSSMDSTNQPDNTARNVRDRNTQTMTPMNQGNSQADINTTAQIRREIIAADGMSTNAKNVKVITRDGQVTLRGPVNSADEKRQIGDIANRVAQSSNVDNQLEVVLTSASNLN
jgi:hypothetical protein